MATVLLSISTNTLYGIGMSEHFGPLTKRLEHPTSPVLLTKNGPEHLLQVRQKKLISGLSKFFLKLAAGIWKILGRPLTPFWRS